MTIGFDFDKVFINYPPLIPDNIVDFLYKGKIFRKNSKNNNLVYRFPGSFEQKIRIISHYHIFRLPNKENIEALKIISQKKSIKSYLISSRYGFLRQKTDEILKKNNLKKYFNDIYFNFENNQPHKFKEDKIRKLKIEKYVDDDLDLSIYLAQKIPKLKIYWLTKNSKTNVNLPKNVIPIKSLKEFKDKYL